MLGIIVAMRTFGCVSPLTNTGLDQAQGGTPLRAPSHRPGLRTQVRSFFVFDDVTDGTTLSFRAPRLTTESAADEQQHRVDFLCGLSARDARQAALLPTHGPRPRKGWRRATASLA